MNIDWSKAPRATHYLNAGDPHTRFRDCSAENWWFYNDRDSTWTEYPMLSAALIERPDCIARPTQLGSYAAAEAAPQPWNGEGLPPVGTVCEIKHEREWRKCEIIAHKTFDDGSKTHAIAWIDANNIDQSHGIRFRRLPTSEQIAADEERERALAVMLKDSVGEEGSAIQDDVARRLYDAGYRKAKP